VNGETYSFLFFRTDGGAWSRQFALSDDAAAVEEAHALLTSQRLIPGGAARVEVRRGSGERIGWWFVEGDELAWATND